MQKVHSTISYHHHAADKELQDRKYFDSGDYALSKAGVAPQTNVGTAIPNPQKYVLCLCDTASSYLSSIPHASSSPSNSHQTLSVSPTNPTSPVNRESGLSHHEETADVPAGDLDPLVPASAPAEKAPITAE